MNYLPKRKKRERSGIRDDDGPIRCPSHLKWVRGHECCAISKPIHCEGRIEAHHLQSFRAIEGGMGMKVGDDKAVPLCNFHHWDIHAVGQPLFEKTYRLSLEATAADLWKASPAGHRYRMQQSQSQPPQGLTTTAHRED